uniref:Small ribosomal subunit protein uS2c n=1 Tax=Golenkinia longispicula TaxID=204992 RepID=A0A0S2ICZ0_9CHLO|nr:ribosomal protein S2 [Golenkinia longispicula]
MKTKSSTNKKNILNIKIGDILELKVSALGHLNKSKKEMGLAELANGYTVVLPNTNLGDLVTAKITKLNETRNAKNQTFGVGSRTANYAVAEVLQVLQQYQNEPPVRVGEVLEVTINKSGPRGSGLLQLPNNFRIVIPNTKIGQTVKAQITRVKFNYAFAKVLPSSKEIDKNIIKSSLFDLSNKSDKKDFSSLIKSKAFLLQGQSELSSHQSIDKPNYLLEGSQLNLILPKTANQYADYIAINVNGLIIFVKVGLGAKLGDRVSIHVTRVERNFGFAKIVKVSPLSRRKTYFKVQKTLKKMLASGMHFGEKSMKCDANMRKFVWLQKKGKQINRPLLQKGRHLINLLKTRQCLIKALQQLAKYAAKGRTFLFIGTKKPAAGLIARAAMLTKTSFFVNTRWLGGMLTNWKTILKSISKIRPILKEKQKIIKNILEKRQQIKTLLIRKVNKLRNKSQQLISKGKLLITKVKKEKKQLLEKSQKLLDKRKQFIERGHVLIEKSKQLMKKKKQINEKTYELQEKINTLLIRKTNLLNQLEISKVALKEQTLLLRIAQELRKFKKLTKQQGKTVWALSYGNIVTLTKQQMINSSITEPSPYNMPPAGNKKGQWIVPNPPKEILNKIILTMKEKFDSNGYTSSFENRKIPLFNKRNTNSAISLNRPKTDEKPNADVQEPSYNIKSSSNTILLSKLINRFSRMLPLLKTQIKTLKLRIQHIKVILINIQETIQTKLQQNLTQNQAMTKKLVSEILFIKMKLNFEQQIIKTLKTKIKKLASEQRLLKFLPKLRYLPTPKNQIAETIQILMKKFVDPKMRYPIDQIYDEKLKSQSKKVAAARKQKWQRLEKYFGGVTKMAKLKNRQISKNVAIVVGQQEEMNAVRECKKLGIKMFNIVDTNCNPRFADHFVPANDDSRNSIKFILGQILTHVRLAQKIRKKVLLRKNQKSKK